MKSNHSQRGSRNRHALRRECDNHKSRFDTLSALWTSVIAAMLLFLTPGLVQAKTYIISGSYTGNDTDNRAITGVGFQPDAVIVKADTNQIGVIRTSTMSGDLSKPMTGATALAANLIQSLDSDGFTIGTDAKVNSNTVSYRWIAFKAASGQMKVGSYTGTGVDNTLVSGVGFNPDLIFIMAATGRAAALRPNTSSNTFDFTNGAGFSGLGSHVADGFYVRTDTRVNENGVTYHYLAWDSISGIQKFNSYVGDGTDNRSITGLGFDPEYVIIKNLQSAQYTVQRPISLGAGDSTQFFYNAANNTNRIQALGTDGFQVGTDNTVNRNGEFHAYFSWALSLPFNVSGKVFEDVNYGGGSGRSWSTVSGSGGSARSGARVEVFDSSGNYLKAATTDASGNYTLSGLDEGTYYVRVVTSSVTSSRTGYTASCLPVMTYRTNASSGTAVAVTDYVGGHDPATADAGNAASGWVLNSSTGAFSGSGSGKAHAFAPVTISSADVTGVDFGWNFDTITNTNNTGQGSLRQFITNANTLGGDASLAQSGLVAAKENAVFMISNGTAAAGLRAANNYFSSGAATIALTSDLPTISTSMIIDAQKQPGWTSTPVVEINGNGVSGTTTVSGLYIAAGSSTVRGLVINRFNNLYGIRIDTNGGNTIAGNYIGISADGSSITPKLFACIRIDGTASNTIGGTTATDRNVIGGAYHGGIELVGAGATGNNIKGNYIGTNSTGDAAVSNETGIGLSSAANNTIGGTTAAERNVISGNTMYGFSFYSSSGNTIQGNYIGTNAAGTGAIANQSGLLLDSSSNNNAIGGTTTGAGNLISLNTLQGVDIDGGTGNAILGNSMVSNGGIGIDLGSYGVTANNGTKNSGLPNYDMDFPVFTYAKLNVTGTSLVVGGYVGSAPNQSTFANARVEVFKSDGDGSGYGEGQTYIGYLTTDADGNFFGNLMVSGAAFTHDHRHGHRREQQHLGVWAEQGGDGHGGGSDCLYGQGSGIRRIGEVADGAGDEQQGVQPVPGGGSGRGVCEAQRRA